ncbi:enoyl-CoA hydratase [Devosia insulae DS-56]|uniref:Enoyl-CoA hydratase n=1 Tax=Devosia insulae DS-56 TaxID=1116389 RepID=A0A1E5XQ50_9HYPH|nr:enoyl-CoA hydratase/isomerase family protein [Devosia insulae]OEO30718.1 enoyl-CoA hydratase [Devosia insulae DS-56]
MASDRQLSIDRTTKGVWVVTFSNPPINLLDPATIDELQRLVGEAEADKSLKVIVFQSANPDFFIAHFDTRKSAEMSAVPGPTGFTPWIDVVMRLSHGPFVSIAKIRGRTRGVGTEFVLACDIRFASRQKAVFGNPEIGVGLPPGGGALEWLPRVIGRSRALEFALSGDDFDADVAERYGLVNRTIDDAELDGFVDALATRLSSFDRDALGQIKAQISRIGVPTGEEIETSNGLFFSGLSRPDAVARRAKLQTVGYGERSTFELNFGRVVTALGPDGSELSSAVSTAN